MLQQFKKCKHAVILKRNDEIHYYESVCSAAKDLGCSNSQIFLALKKGNSTVYGWNVIDTNNISEDLTLLEQVKLLKEDLEKNNAKKLN